jgi:hypothetical protein
LSNETLLNKVTITLTEPEGGPVFMDLKMEPTPTDPTKIPLAYELAGEMIKHYLLLTGIAELDKNGDLVEVTDDLSLDGMKPQSDRLN